MIDPATLKGQFDDCVERLLLLADILTSAGESSGAHRLKNVAQLVTAQFDLLEQIYELEPKESNQ